MTLLVAYFLGGLGAGLLAAGVALLVILAGERWA